MYKTIVVHVDDKPQMRSRLAVAAGLATRFEAHLVGSAVTGISRGNYLLLGTSPMAALPDSDFDRLVEHGQAQLTAFTREVERLGVASWEQRLIEDDAGHALLLEARYADLIVVSAAAPTRLHLGASLPEFVALHGTRPVLVVPEDYPGDAAGGTAVVAWNGSMEATRAVTGALPLLRSARAVKVALINPDETDGLYGEQPGADLATWLARHGVEVEVVCERSEVGAAPALLGLAREIGAALLVAGAYGHSRYREWISGGATRGLLAGATMPLLLAH
ncbi:universal stress protein [Massilia sp. YMA4]|uniref:universal stress protein n=1 Tax=Massilia sp. YMA4 TaxID=1593482 RepID=UPI000DD13E1A|nr:universal stress protein [Massilia sp. YMA4]AXA91556.1 universal stress protein [Massilia sp. YMA4]